MKPCAICGTPFEPRRADQKYCRMACASTAASRRARAGVRVSPGPRQSRDGDHAATDAEWMVEANCSGVDPELMFPGRGEDVRAAKAVCAGCAVRQQCLEYALTHGERYGIWGGLSEAQRRRIRQRRTRGAA